MYVSMCLTAHHVPRHCVDMAQVRTCMCCLYMSSIEPGGLLRCWYRINSSTTSGAWVEDDEPKSGNPKP